MRQGTAEWHAARCGKATASRIADIVARTKTGWGASRANYAAELVAERLTGAPAEGFKSAAMQWGTETEDQARAAYEFYRSVTVTEVGFISHPTIPLSGASPDGFVGESGLLEIKCPSTATHISTLLGAPIAKSYHLQIQWQMACTHREWCDFVSFDPRMPEELRLFVSRFERVIITDIEKQVIEFLAEVAEKEAALRALMTRREAA